MNFIKKLVKFYFSFLLISFGILGFIDLSIKLVRPDIFDMRIFDSSTLGFVILYVLFIALGFAFLIPSKK